MELSIYLILLLFLLYSILLGYNLYKIKQHNGEHRKLKSIINDLEKQHDYDLRAVKDLIDSHSKTNNKPSGKKLLKG